MTRSTTDPSRRAVRGMTLVELIAVIVILGIIGTASAFFFATGMKGFSQTDPLRTRLPRPRRQWSA